MILAIYNLLNKVCPEWLEIEEPETLSIILNRHNVEVDGNINDIINALKACCLMETPWLNPYIFENVVDAFNDNIVITETLTKPPIEDILYAVHTMQSIRQRDFSEEVAKYIACVAIADNILYLPAPLDFANEYIPPDDLGLQSEVKLLTENIELLNLERPYQETPLEIQACKLAAIWQEYNRKIG